ncbi:MAG: hypothetical protein ABI323_02250 [Solirubrobacteraceae bacterium]
MTEQEEGTDNDDRDHQTAGGKRQRSHQRPPATGHKAGIEPNGAVDAVDPAALGFFLQAVDESVCGM